MNIFKIMLGFTVWICSFCSTSFSGRYIAAGESTIFHFDRLPMELKTEIIKKVNPQELPRLSRVSQEWEQIVKKAGIDLLREQFSIKKVNQVIENLSQQCLSAREITLEKIYDCLVIKKVVNSKSDEENPYHTFREILFVMILAFSLFLAGYLDGLRHPVVYQNPI